MHHWNLQMLSQLQYWPYWWPLLSNRTKLQTPIFLIFEMLVTLTWEVIHPSKLYRHKTVLYLGKTNTVCCKMRCFEIEPNYKQTFWVRFGQWSLLMCWKYDLFYILHCLYVCECWILMLLCITENNKQDLKSYQCCLLSAITFQTNNFYFSVTFCSSSLGTSLTMNSCLHLAMFTVPGVPDFDTLAWANASSQNLFGV